jgi:transposase
MLNGITVAVTAKDRAKLEAVVADRNSPQKHVWRARIILLTADGCGTAEIMRGSGTSKTAVWRWQERFMMEGVAGLLRDKSRPARIAALGTEVESRVVQATLSDLPTGEATHWTAPAMAKAQGISVSSVQRIWRRHGLQPHRTRHFKLSNDSIRRQAARYRWSLCQPASARHGAVHRREKPNPGARPDPAWLAAEKGTLRHDDARL